MAAHWFYSCVVYFVMVSATNENEESIENLTTITWAHAVNNRAYLEAALASDVSMLEADIVLGHISGAEDGPVIPIMAHPPAHTSDISLAQFLETVSQFNQDNDSPKGVKLDFKSIEAFEGSQDQIADVINLEMKSPLWLNADILPGPVEATATPVDAQQFLKLSSQHPRAMLSVGWTTRYGGDVDKAEYTVEHARSMVNLLKELNVGQTVTFPVRAGIAAESQSVLLDLLKETAALDSTLTVWSSAADPVDVDKLRDLMLNVGLDRTYLDVPPELASALHLPESN